MLKEIQKAETNQAGIRLAMQFDRGFEYSNNAIGFILRILK